MRRVDLELLSAGRCYHPEAVAVAGGPWCPACFPGGFALIRHPQHGAILFDTGYAPRFAAATASWPERLYALATPVEVGAGESAVEQLVARGIAARDVGLVIVSHLHADHIAGLRDFPAARIACMRAAVAPLAGLGRFGAVRRGILPRLLPDDWRARLALLDERPARDLPGALTALGRGLDVLGDGSLLAVPLPGHAAGHTGLLLRDGTGRLRLLVADACWRRRSYREDRPPHLVAGLITHDRAAYRQTLGRLHAVHRATPDIALVPSHCLEETPA